MKKPELERDYWKKYKENKKKREWNLSAKEGCGCGDEKPCEETERTLRTSVAPLTEVSIGNVTKRSTSSDAIPCASVITTTVGEVKSGKTSTSIFIAVLVPRTTNNTELSKMRYLLFSENFIILFIMAVRFNDYDLNEHLKRLLPGPV